MSLFPLYVIGCYNNRSTENTLNYAISSYSPTLKTLQFIQNKRILSSPTQKHNIIVISIPETPGHTNLKTNEEVVAIQKHGRTLVLIKHLKNPTKSDVLDHLKSCIIAHFAYYRIANNIKPAQSALIIGRETKELLIINNLDTVTHESAQIAYLSAYSTAEMRAQDLVNESIHLASTFQLARFQHIIGTLWGADDNAAVEIADKFYKRLL